MFLFFINHFAKHVSFLAGGLTGPSAGAVIVEKLSYGSWSFAKS
jgi:hypothetical protein